MATEDTSTEIIVYEKNESGEIIGWHKEVKGAK